MPVIDEALIISSAARRQLLEKVVRISSSDLKFINRYQTCVEA